jgi:hypothetical protein
MRVEDMMDLVRTAAADDDPRSGLAAAARLRQELERVEAVQVRRARARGLTWEQIAGPLGRDPAGRAPQVRRAGAARAPPVSSEAPVRRASFAEFLPYLRGHVPLLVTAGIISLAATGLAVLQPLMVQQLINAVGRGEAWSTFAWLLVAITLGSAVFSAGQSYLLQRTAESVVLGVRRSLVGQLLRLPVSEFDSRRVGDLMSRVGSDTTLLRSVITSGLFEIVSSVLMFAAAVVLMILLDPLLFSHHRHRVLGGAACVVLPGDR